MRISLPGWLLICTAAFAAGCSTGDPGPGIDVDRALGHVGQLVALGPHPGESAGAQRAREYIEGQLEAAGARVERMPVGTVELPAIEVAGVRRRAATTRATTDPNVVVRFGPETGKALLVMAHHDTVARSPGAVDNAAAVAVVIELARGLAAVAPPFPVMLVFTANEEVELVGAEALAARYGDRIAMAIALDLIGGTGDLSLNGASRQIGRAELGWLAAAADRAGVVVRAPLPHRVVSRTWPQAERADHGPFTRRGVAAFHLYHRGQDGERIDLAYHSARDTAARVDRGSVDEIGRLLRALVATPPPVHAGDGFWLPIAINTVVPRWWIVALEVALAALGLGLLVTLRASRSTGGGSGLLVGVVCFAAALGTAVLVERLAGGEHPAAWLHAPGRAQLAALAVLAGAFGLVSVVVRRVAPWTGDRRYLAIAAGLPLAIGTGCLALGAAELAWIWLVPAAVTAAAPRLGRLGGLAIATGLLPGALVLAPAQLREVAWNGFLPLSIPLAAWVAGFALPPLVGLAWWLRRAQPAGPLGALVLPTVSAAAVLAGAAVLLRSPPPCSRQQFAELHLACEVASAR